MTQLLHEGVGTTARAAPDDGHRATGSRAGPAHGVAWRDVAGFVALAYGLAWALWFAVVPNIGRLFTAERTPAELEAPDAVALGMFAPMLAAIAMRRFVSKEGLRGSLGSFRRWRWYAVALLVPAALVTAVIVLVVATGRGDFTAPHDSLPVTYLALAIRAVTVGSLLTFGEEYGWRGYLLPKLLPLGEVKAALIVGLIWGPWHVPVLIAGLNYPGVNPWAAIGVFIPAGIIMSLLVTRLYVAAGASVLVATVFHAGLNAYGDNLTDSEHLSGNPLVVFAGGAIGMGVIALAAVLAFSLHRRFRGSARQRVSAAPSSEAATAPAHQAATAHGRSSPLPWLDRRRAPAQPRFVERGYATSGSRITFSRSGVDRRST